jgi:hypothetical protein
MGGGMGGGAPPMFRKGGRYEGSKADIAKDKKGMKATGMTAAEYERSARDKREDRAGERRRG